MNTPPKRLILPGRARRGWIGGIDTHEPRTTLQPVDISERLSNDESLTDNLTDDEAKCLIAWAETRCGTEISDEQGEKLIAAIRELNRRVGQGERLEEILNSEF